MTAVVHMRWATRVPNISAFDPGRNLLYPEFFRFQKQINFILSKYSGRFLNDNTR